MITLFRKTRRRLMSDKKITSYLAYAFGEILLVVIGILIALSINNLNENRKKGEQEIQLLTELKEAFKGDEEDLRRMISSANFFEGHLDTLLRLSKGSLPYTPEMNKYFGALTSTFFFTPRTGPYETLKGVGLGLISDDELRQAISNLHDFEYINYRDGIVAGVEHENNLIRTFAFEHFIDEGFENGYSGLKPYDFDKIQRSGKLSSVVNRMISLQALKKYHAQRLKEMVRRVINQIDTELN